MNSLVEYMTVMDVLTDQVIAADFLISTKSGIMNYALALSETTTPSVRTVMKNQLDQAIAMHGQISDLMIKHGWYSAYDINQQIQLDMKNADKALYLVQGSIT
jgi:similar to spore coat protein